jgi:hypothetical protein
MSVFSRSESLEEFKHRLNILTEKLNKANKDLDQEPQKTLALQRIDENPDKNNSEKSQSSFDYSGIDSQR